MEENNEYIKTIVTLALKYCRIDYDDDEDLVEMMVDVSIHEMKELIPKEKFDENNLTTRQKLLVCVCVKDLYDNRDKYANSQEKLQSAVSSMLLKEIYGGSEQ